MNRNCILRKNFLDRVMDAAELAALAEMLRLWCVERSSQVNGSGSYYCSAQINWFPRQDQDAIVRSLASELPNPAFDTHDPDEVCVIGNAGALFAPSDISVWRQVLANPLVAGATVQLRITFDARFKRVTDGSGDGTSTFVLCGSPVNGALLLKALWQVGRDESMKLIYHLTPWRMESDFLAAFERYQQQKGATSTDVDAAADALSLLTKDPGKIFRARADEKKVMWIFRLLYEMPDARTPGAFIGRLSIPVTVAIFLIVAMIQLQRGSREWSWALGAAAGFMLLVAGIIAGKKIQRIVQYYKKMSKTLGKLHSEPIKFHQIDLSRDQSATLIKYSRDLEALGGRLVCDVAFDSAGEVKSGSRVYVFGDAMVILIALYSTGKFMIFPPMPVIQMTTRFKDGSKHITKNAVGAEKAPLRSTMRCLAEEGGPVNDVVALHQRHVDRLIAGGAVPTAPPVNTQSVLKRLHEDQVEGAELWHRYGYSWSDALYDAFKTTRRPYRAD